MKDNKNLWIGIGAVVVIVVIILIAVLTGKKNVDTVPAETTPTVTETETSTPAKKPTTNNAPAKSSFAFSFPTNGSVLTRGTTYSVAWTGTADCYDLGYAYNPRQDTPYNFIAKVCENKAGAFNYKWLVPPNLQPGTYGMELKNSNSTGDSTTSSVFTLK